MKKALFLLLAASFLFTGAAIAGDAMNYHVSDGKCKADHADHSEGSISCAKRCIEGGQDTVLVDAEGEVHVVSNPDVLKGHAGHEINAKVTVQDDGKVMVDADSVKHVAP